MVLNPIAGPVFAPLCKEELPEPYKMTPSSLLVWMFLNKQLDLVSVGCGPYFHCLAAEPDWHLP